MSDIVERARKYLAANAAESGADVLIDELASEITRLRSLTEWRPIETAPKNEAEVLLFWPFITQDGYATNGFWDDPGPGVEPHWYSPTVNGGATQPTHWLPLPPAPEVKK